MEGNISGCPTADSIHNAASIAYNGPMPYASLYNPVGIAVINETLFYRRFNNPAKRLMDNPVFKTSRRDQPFLGNVDIKTMIGPMPVRLSDKFFP
jgi:hypothetical protein